jgi:hypothetical protein
VASRLGRAAGVALAVAIVAGCGATTTGQVKPGSQVSAQDLTSYVAAVQRIRLPVNQLLERADPILNAYHRHRISPLRASHRFARLEGKFAAFALQAQQISPPDVTLQAVNAPYAHTYFLEDSYLATLASDLREGDFDNLPNTQGAQRLAIIEWRIQLEVLAAKANVTLPSNLQQAGRGEIAPAIDGS